jgi:predicted metal-binding membrane protein
MAVDGTASRPASAPNRAAVMDSSHGSALCPDSHAGAPTAARRRDLWALAGGLSALFAASWAWLIYQHWAMQHMDIVEMAMPSTGPWSAEDLMLIFVMWAIMMVAMMLPSALPMLLVYCRVVASRGANAPPGIRTGVFAAGYLFAWTVFSASATLAQWVLHAAALISPMQMVSAPSLGGTLLIAGGIYQWTPLKHACLARCRSPLMFLTTHWRDGASGAFVIGVRHGFHCTGCCWLLMAVLFVVGVMNIAWIVILATLVLAEKILPKGEWIARASGIALIVWGGYLLASTAHMPI